MMNLFKTLSRRGYERKLPAVNIGRCTIAAFFLSVFIPLILLVNIVFLNQTLIRPEYNKYLFGILILSVMYLFIRMIIGDGRVARKYYKYLYRGYLILCSGFMILLCNSFFDREGSLFYFFLCMIFFAIVPVFEKTELIIAEIVSVFFMGSLIVANIETTSVISQVLVFNFVRIAVTLWKYSIVFDTLELKEKLSRERDISEKDVITGFDNLHGLDRRMDIVWNVCCKNKLSCGAIVIDIEKAVKLYDYYGFTSKNDCLVKISNQIKAMLRKKTDIFARISTYKLVVIIQDTEREEMLLVGKKIRSGLGLDEGVTIGISLLNDTNKHSYKNMLSVADKSLSVARKAENGAIAYGTKIVSTGNSTAVKFDF